MVLSALLWIFLLGNIGKVSLPISTSNSLIRKGYPFIVATLGCHVD